MVLKCFVNCSGVVDVLAQLVIRPNKSSLRNFEKDRKRRKLLRKRIPAEYLVLQKSEYFLVSKFRPTGNLLQYIAFGNLNEQASETKRENIQKNTEQIFPALCQ